MVYSDFTFAQVREAVDFRVEETHNLFSAIQGVQPSEHLTLTLAENILLATAIGTPKKRSEFLIAPIRSEVRRQSNIMDIHPDLILGSNRSSRPTQSQILVLSP